MWANNKQFGGVEWHRSYSSMVWCGGAEREKGVGRSGRRGRRGGRGGRVDWMWMWMWKRIVDKGRNKVHLVKEGSTLASGQACEGRDLRDEAGPRSTW